MNADNSGFADIIVPGSVMQNTKITNPTDAYFSADFTEILRLIRDGQNDKASFRRVSEAAKHYIESDIYNTDVYIPNGVNVWRYMSPDQLRSYFYHRENFKIGVFTTKYPSYIYLYIGEVLLEDNAPSELAFILANTAAKYPNIKSDLCRYIKDYYIVNDIHTPFYRYVQDIGAENFFSVYKPTGESDITAVLYNSGNYDIGKSRFLSDHPRIRDDIRPLFDSVLHNLSPFFELSGINIGAILKTEGAEKEYYYPFTGVLYCNDFTRQGSVTLSQSESYERRGAWFMRGVVYTPQPLRKFAGYILKHMDELLRSAHGYKYRLKDNAENLSDDFLRYDGSKLAVRLAHIIASEETAAIIREIIDTYIKTGETDIVTPRSDAMQSLLKTEPYRTYASMTRIDTAPEDSLAVAAKLRFERMDDLSLTSEQDIDSLAEQTSVPISSSPEKMSIEQFRFFIIWRTRIREGVIAPAPIVYAKMYLSGLLYSDKLTGIDVLDKTADFIKAYAYFDKGFPQLLKDIYIFRIAGANKIDDDPAESFESIIIRHDLTEYFPEIFIHSQDKAYKLQAIAKIGNAGIKKSKFFMPETEALITASVNAVYEKMYALLEEAGAKPESIFFERGVCEYRAFERGTLFYPPAIPPGREIKLSAYEFYRADRFQNIVRTAYDPERKLFGLICSFIVKETEAALRNAVGFKGKASGSPNFSERFKQKFDSKFANDYYNTEREKLWTIAAGFLCSDEFPAMTRLTAQQVLQSDFADITFPEKQAPRRKNAYYEEPAVFVPTEVKVDFGTLDTIRKDAEATAMKLITEEADPADADPHTNADLHTNADPHTDGITEPLTAEKNADKTADKSAFEKTDERTQEALAPSDNPYNTLFTNLSEDYKEILRRIINKESPDAFLRERGLLPEVAADEINEKALEITGDILFEDGFDIIEDYKEELTRAVENDYS